MKSLLLIAFLGALLSAQEVSHYDAIKAQARQELNDGNAAKALALAQSIAQKAPDDIELQYTVAKAHRLAGNLVEAEKSTQWLLDLRPEFLGGRHEAALLREQFQDLAGAVDLLNSVYRATPASKYTERRMILADLARIFERQNLKQDAAQLRAEITRLKGLETANEKATANPAHK